MWLSSSLKCLRAHAALMAGFGTLLIGLAACYALSQTRSVINEVLKIQRQAADIKYAIDLLAVQITSLYATNVIDSTKLNSTSATQDEIFKVLSTIPNAPEGNKPQVFLPSGDMNKVAEDLYKASPEDRKRILQQSLQYSDSKNNSH